MTNKLAKDRTTILIARKTRDRLQRIIKNKMETYDDILNRILDEYTSRDLQ